MLNKYPLKVSADTTSMYHHSNLLGKPSAHKVPTNSVEYNKSTPTYIYW